VIPVINKNKAFVKTIKDDLGKIIAHLNHTVMLKCLCDYLYFDQYGMLKVHAWYIIGSNLMLILFLYNMQSIAIFPHSLCSIHLNKIAWRKYQIIFQSQLALC